ncbi:MAG: 50S ribosomal protein L22 [uncultured bacterium]|nr:MAG: 50S ribosomal protein L22 [uncultured bacterium]
MEFIAKAKVQRITPRKLGLLAGMVRGQGVQRAIENLKYSDKQYAKPLVALIQSAVNNASQSKGVNVDTLYVKTVEVGQSVTLKRFMTRARGSASRILKRCSNITVIVDEKVN